MDEAIDEELAFANPKLNEKVDSAMELIARTEQAEKLQIANAEAINTDIDHPSADIAILHVTPAPILQQLPWQKGAFDTTVKRTPREFLFALTAYYKDYDDWLS